MANINHMVEQHIVQYESHLKHMDELLERARKGVDETPEHAEVSEALEKLAGEREKLAGHVEELRLKPLEDWQEQEIELAGPMGIWDAVAQQLEKLVERIERLCAHVEIRLKGISPFHQSCNESKTVYNPCGQYLTLGYKREVGNVANN